MKNIWKKHKFLVSIAGYLVFMAIFIFCAILPGVANIKKAADKIQEKMIDNQINRDRIERIPEREAAFGDFLKKENDIRLVLDPNEKVDFIKKMEGLAETTENKVSIKVIQEENKPLDAKAKAAAKKRKEEPGIKEKLTYPNYFSLELSVKGDYKGLINLINKIENTYNYVNIISLNIKKEKSGEAKSALSSDIFASQNPTVSNPTDTQEDNSNKEYINSTLTVIVYTNK